jgi:hypothetical protein
MSESPIFSILDAFKYETSDIFAFLDLGEAPLHLRHVIVVFRDTFGVSLLVAKESRITLSPFVSLFEVRCEKQDTLYGYLFSVKDSSSLRLTRKVLSYKQADSLGEFAILPCLNDKNGVFLYKDTKGNLLANISNSVGSKFVVLDE